MPDPTATAESHATTRTKRESRKTRVHPSETSKSLGSGGGISVFVSQCKHCFKRIDQQRRRREREELWIEYGCEEREDLDAKKQEELDKMSQAQRIKWNEDMREQLVQHELKKQAMREEELNERLWVCVY